MALQVEITTSHPNKRVSYKKVMDTVRKCSSLTVPADAQISVAFLGDREMKGINESYTGRKGSTDVLSFPLGKAQGGKRWCGEVIISLDRACRQASSKKMTLMQEVTRLIVHSMVHLGGLDHYDKKGFVRMRRVEFGLLLKCL